MIGINIPEEAVEHVFKFNPYTHSITRIGDALYAVVNDKKCLDTMVMKCSTTEFTLINESELGMKYVESEFATEVIKLIENNSSDHLLGKAVRGVFKALVDPDAGYDENEERI